MDIKDTKKEVTKEKEKEKEEKEIGSPETHNLAVIRDCRVLLVPPTVYSPVHKVSKGFRAKEIITDLNTKISCLKFNPALFTFVK